MRWRCILDGMGTAQREASSNEEVGLAVPRPPGPGWRELFDGTGEAGYVSIYYSDPLARYPVRWITRPRDNKSDPNLETATYGLFSTCGLHMRGKLVREVRPHLFFVTKRGPGRVLAGYYEIGWCAESTGGAEHGDYALAARRMRWIAPLPLTSLPRSIRDVLVPPFRSCRPLDPDACAVLLDVVYSADDLTAAYVEEIERLERYALDASGFRYPSWARIQGFRTDDMARYLGAVPRPPARPASKTGWWRCRECTRVTRSEAALKSCPLCSAMGSLHPEEAP